MVDIIGKLGDPKADAAALQPIIDEAEGRAAHDIVNEIVPALEAALTRVLVGRKIQISITIN